MNIKWRIDRYKKNLKREDFICVPLKHMLLTSVVLTGRTRPVLTVESSAQIGIKMRSTYYKI